MAHQGISGICSCLDFRRMVTLSVALADKPPRIYEVSSGGAAHKNGCPTTLIRNRRTARFFGCLHISAKRRPRRLLAVNHLPTGGANSPNETERTHCWFQPELAGR